MEDRNDIRDLMDGNDEVMKTYIAAIIDENNRDVATANNSRRMAPVILVDALPTMLENDKEMTLVYIIAGALIYSGIGVSLCPPGNTMYTTWLKEVAGPLLGEFYNGIVSMPDLHGKLKTSYYEWFGR